MLTTKRSLDGLSTGRSANFAHAGRNAAEDARGRRKLACYILRAPLALEKMTCDAKGGAGIYRSKKRLDLKRNVHVRWGAPSGWTSSAATTLSAMSTSFATAAGTPTAAGANVPNGPS